MTSSLLRVSRPIARVSQPGSSWAPLAKPLDIGVLYSGIVGGAQRNGSHPSYVATNAYGYWEQYPTGTTYASGFWLSQAKPMYAGLGSSFLWHGRITAHSASYPYVAGKWQTPTVSGNNAGQFYLMISASGNIGVTVHRGASGVSTLYTSIQAQLGVPITVLLNFSDLGIDVITSKGREFLSLTGMGSLGSAVAAFGVTVGAPGSGFSGHQYARTGLMVWSDKKLPDDVIKNPWQVFAARTTTYLFSVTALANTISLGLVSAQFSAQAYQASADSALGAGAAGAGAYAVSPAGVLSTAVGTVPVTSQAAFVSAVQSLQSASVSLNSPDLDYILGALGNAVSLGLASISSTARAITYSTPGGTVHVVPYEFLGDYDIVHFSGSIAVDRAGALIIVLR